MPVKLNSRISLIRIITQIRPTQVCKFCNTILAFFSINLHNIIIYIDRWWEKYLSERSLMKHICLWWNMFFFLEHWTEKKLFTYITGNSVHVKCYFDVLINWNTELEIKFGFLFLYWRWCIKHKIKCFFDFQNNWTLKFKFEVLFPFSF